MKDVKIKICGLKHNIIEVAALNPDYIGFIFYDKSPRYFDGNEIPALPKGIKKVGVFVNAGPNEIVHTVNKHKLDVIQLHGDETKEQLVAIQCALEQFVNHGYEVWKVFNVGDDFDFSELIPFEGNVDKFLFDTKGDERGGNGKPFNWDVLKKYPCKTPFILSGGIGPDSVPKIKKILKTDLPLYALDVNSRFEIYSGLKDSEKLKIFMEDLNS